MAKVRKLLKGAKSLLDDAAEKVGTSTMRRTRRQTKRPSNVVQRDAKTGRVRAVSRGERVKRGKDIGKAVGATTGVVGAGAAAATGAKSLDPSSKADKKESKSSTAKTRSQTAGKRSTIKKERIGSGRSMYMLDGRLNISKENLKDSGMTLTEYANYMQKNKKRPPKAQKKMGGGMMKSKMASKGGAKGGKRMPPGMKAGGSASKFPDLSGDGKVTQKDILMGKGVIKKQAGGMMKSKMSSKGGAKGGRRPGGMQAGGMMKSKGMAKGGAMKKKGYAMGGMTKKGMAKGGSVRKTTKPRGVGAALRGYGKAMKK
tara:strand:+ start:513 stop:1454 length:942 start_codon:yes stop_codon:yes gene_type:complete